MYALGSYPGELLLYPGAGERRDPDFDADVGSTIYGDAVLWGQENDAFFTGAGVYGRKGSGAYVVAADGVGSHLPAAEFQSRGCGT